MCLSLVLGCISNCNRMIFCRRVFMGLVVLSLWNC